MSQPAISTGLDGIIASGNVPSWIIQESVITEPLTDTTTEIPAEYLTDPTTVKTDCYHDMGDISFTRTAITRDRKRACEIVTVTRKTGETIDGTLTAIYDQQAEAADEINAVYEATPEGSTIYVAIGYGHRSSPTDLPTRVDIYRGDVQQRDKNLPVEGEDLEFTATISADLYLQDVTVTPTV